MQTASARKTPPPGLRIEANYLLPNPISKGDSFKMDPNPKPGIDKAKWNRFAKGNKANCVVCGRRAEVTVRLNAFGIQKGEGMLVGQTFPFCDEHGQERFAGALMALQGTNHV